MYSMPAKGDKNVDVIARKLYALDALAHANHVNTRSFSAHKAFGKFYEFTSEFKDRIIEYLMGQGKLISVKVAVLEIGEDVVAEAEALNKMIYDYSYMCDDDTLENMSADFQEAIAKLKYMLMLK